MSTQTVTFQFSLGDMTPERTRAVLRSIDNMLVNDHNTVLAPVFVTPGHPSDDAAGVLQTITDELTSEG